MGRSWIGAVMLAGVLAAVPARALDHGLWSLQELGVVRLEVVGDPGTEVELLRIAVSRSLADAGLRVEPEAPAVLEVETSSSSESLAAFATLTQPVLLERDPLVSVRLPTWSAGEARRPGDEGVEGVVQRVVEDFLADWRAANPGTGPVGLR